MSALLVRYPQHRTLPCPTEPRPAETRLLVASLRPICKQCARPPQPPCDHPLLQFDNVLVSPHTASVTRETRFNMGRIAAEQVLDALDGRPVPRKVNPEVWPLYPQRFAQRFGFKPSE